LNPAIIAIPVIVWLVIMSGMGAWWWKRRKERKAYEATLREERRKRRAATSRGGVGSIGSGDGKPRDLEIGVKLGVREDGLYMGKI
jgi:hypothetical protein